jgi:CheY-like chemotaxis protein
LNEDYFGKYNWEGKTILIVEDDISSIFYLREVLADTHANLIITKDGGAAVDICTHDPSIDIVLMDIQIPVLDGYNTTKKIKNAKPRLPVIAQTAYAMLEDRKKCFDAGCDDYISKPIEPFALLDKINIYLSGKSGSK